MRITDRRLRQLIREALAVDTDESYIRNLPFDDIGHGLEIAKRKAGEKPMDFVRDVDDVYIYAAIGGNLEVGPNYAPDMFVVIHDGARPDKKSLGAVFRPNDPAPDANRFLPAIVDPADEAAFAAAESLAQELTAAYKGENSYQFLVNNIRKGVLPAGPAAAVAAESPPEATPELVPAAAASSPSAAAAVADSVAAAASEVVVGTTRDEAAPVQGQPKTGKSWFERLFQGNRTRYRPQREVSHWNERWRELTPTERQIFKKAVSGDVEGARKLTAKAVTTQNSAFSDLRMSSLLREKPLNRFAGGVGNADLRDVQNMLTKIDKIEEYISDRAHVGVVGEDYNLALLNSHSATAALLVAASMYMGDGNITVDNIDISKQ